MLAMGFTFIVGSLLHHHDASEADHCLLCILSAPVAVSPGIFTLYLIMAIIACIVTAAPVRLVKQHVFTVSPRAPPA